MQLERVVIGVDLTRASSDAAVWAAREFAPDAQIVFLHCLSPLLPEIRILEERAVAESYLHDLKDRIGSKRTSYRIRIGDPARCLAEIAAELDADLIAVGSHEEHADRAPALGSTAQRLVRCSPVPVLLCAPSPAGAPRSVLLPLDSVEVPVTVAEWTEALANRFGARLALVHVEPPADERRLTSRRTVPRRQVTTPWTRLARDLPRDRVFVDAVIGDRAEAVLAESRRFRSELVLLQVPDDEAPGPTAPVDRVLRRSECPVLVIPPLENETFMGTR